MSYPTVQIYSGGTEAAWIEPTVGGQEPESPAPVLTLGASGDGTAAGGTDPGAGDADADADADAGADAGEQATDGSHEASPGALALFLSILALLVGLAGVVLGWRAQRRTGSS